MSSAPQTKRALEVTGFAQKRAWAEKAFPPVEHLARDIWSIPVPIPDSPLRYVLSYAISTPKGPIVVDPGWPGSAGWNALKAGLAAAGWDVPDVHGVLVTHAHVDHQGQSARLREESGCWVAMHSADARVLAGYVDGSLTEMCNHAWLDACGVPSSERGQGIEMNAESMRMACDMVPDRLLADHDSGFVPGRECRAIWTPGHTPGHLCFALPDDGVLLGGDHLLPRISSHVGGYRVDAADALGDFLRSMGSVGVLDPDTEVLPGHEYRFRGIEPRVRGVFTHHAERLAQVFGAIDRLGSSTWDVASSVSWARGWDETTGRLRRLALAETAAHLRWLALRGLVEEVPTTPTRWQVVSVSASAERIAQLLEKEYGVRFR